MFRPYPVLTLCATLAVLSSACGVPFTALDLPRIAADPAIENGHLCPSGDCQVIATAAPPSTWWTSPASTWIGVGEPPPCPTPPAWEAFEKLAPAPATCSCDCKPDQPGETTLAGVTWGQGLTDPLSCGYDYGAIGGVFSGPNPGGCIAVKPNAPPNGKHWQCIGASLTASTGSCFPRPVLAAPTPTPDASAERARSCFAADLAAADGFKLCIMAAGAQACPELFPTAHPMFTSAADSRDCGPCFCGPDPGLPTLDVLAYMDASCGNPVAHLMAPGAFGKTLDINYASGPTASIKVATSWAPAGCPVTIPSTPGGDIAPAGAVTVCCQ